MLPQQTNSSSSKPKEETTKLLIGVNNRLEELAVQDFLIIYNNERIVKTAYYLWFFLGLFGVHHIYLRRYLHFLLCIFWLCIISAFRFLDIYILCMIGPYVLVWLIDGFRIKKLVEIANNRLVPKEKQTNPWNIYDIYLFWIPPFGFGGLYYFYMGYYWRFLTYLFNLGFVGFGWLLDLFLIPCYYYPKLKQSFLNKINNNESNNNNNNNNEIAIKHDKTKVQLWMCWFPMSGWLGFHHFYCGDVILGVCYFFSCGCWFIGWFIDIFLLARYYRRFDESIEKQYEKWKKENGDGKVSATDNPSVKFQPKHPLIFKKTLYHSYMTWTCLLHHLYLHNWVIFLGQILTLGGCGVMWLADLCLMPSFVQYSNERLGLNDDVIHENNNKNIHTNQENNNNNVIITKETDEIKHIQYNFDIEYKRGLYTAYLYWTPLMGCIGAYYIYLGNYKQFLLRFFTLNFFLIGWIIDAFRIPGLVQTKLKQQEAENNNNQTESLIK